jgi:hypothetical protein
MTLLAFVAALLGSLIAFGNPLAGAIIAAALFAAGFVAWNWTSDCQNNRNGRSDRLELMCGGYPAF